MGLGISVGGQEICAPPTWNCIIYQHEVLDCDLKLAGFIGSILGTFNGSPLSCQAEAGIVKASVDLSSSIFLRGRYTTFDEWGGCLDFFHHTASYPLRLA